MQKTNEPFGTPDADGWYEWKGNDMVRPAGRVEVVFRGGQSETDAAKNWHWKHDGSISDIVKWRPIVLGCLPKIREDGE